MDFDINLINFNKMNGLVPVCVQDAKTRTVLMIGFMNLEALEATLEEKVVIFYSRTKERLWKKGETTKHYLEVMAIATDCDHDSLLILASPQGPTCHLSKQSCFNIENKPFSLGYLSILMETLASRLGVKESYTQQLIDAGIPRIAQKIGEEGIEVALAGVIGTNEAVVNEIADLFYHILVMLLTRGISLTEISRELERRNK